MAANGVQLYAIAEVTNADGKLSNDGGSFTVKLSASYTYENK